MPHDPKKLGRYRDKRVPGVTNEPFGDEAGAALGGSEERAVDSSATQTELGAFVVHLHHATRRHYDVRLEVGGVLMSFAVPHGPSLDPAKKVLAIMTEEHPIEYVDFEDVIPGGQYGAGPMIVWDRGAVAYIEGPAEKELGLGKLHVELRGMKLRGRWAFVKLAKGETGREWLLFKKQDAEANPSRSIVDDLPRSVLSGLTVDELERRVEIAAEHLERARKLGAKRSASLVVELRERGRSPLMNVALHGRPAATRGAAAAKSRRVYDAELDGVRVLAVRDGDVIALRLWTKDSVEAIEAFYPDVVRALRALPVTRLAVDGELVAFDATGHPNTTLLAKRVAQLANGEAHLAVSVTPVVLVVKDILALGDLDTRALPLHRRRALVSALLPSVGYLRAATPLEGDEARVLEACASLGVEAVVAKERESHYTEGAGTWSLLSTGIAPRARLAVDHDPCDPADVPRAGVRRGAPPRQVVVSNRDKIFWPADPDAHLPAYTKGDLVDYYATVADLIGPYLKDRPVILVRYPDGIEGKSFFQWNVPAGMPPWIRTLTLSDDDETPASRRPEGHVSAEAPTPSQRAPKRVFLVDDPATLVYIANLGCIPLHVLASRAPDLSRADFFTLDFDVKQSSLRHAVTLARSLRELLEEIGLRGYPKTSGQSGLHVLVPLGDHQSFETARALADLLGRLLVERYPDIATMNRTISRRGDRVYVDTGQTGTSRAIVAPYSVRAVRGATVSTPLSWDEVTPELDPSVYTIASVPARIAERGDLFEGLLGTAVDVAGAVEKLAEIAQGTQR